MNEALRDYASSEGKRTKGELMIVELCRYMGGWTYQDYLNQPDFFIEAALRKMDLDGQISSKNANR